MAPTPTSPTLASLFGTSHRLRQGRPIRSAKLAFTPSGIRLLNKRDSVLSPTHAPPKTPFQALKWLLLPPALLLLLFSGHIIAFGRGGQFDLPSWRSRPRESDYYDRGASFAPYKIQKLWAAYSPYHSVEEYKSPPIDCRLTQLQRHGARYPTFGFAINIAQALLRLQAAESYTDERLNFISSYQYDLGVDDLVPFGELQTSESGRKSFVRYSTLANEHNLPFVRASGSDRVVRSALKWIEGFNAGSDGTLRPSLGLIIPEIKRYQEGHNNTLEDKSCPNAGHPTAPLQQWQSVYAKPIADRFNTIARGQKIKSHRKKMPENLTSEDAQSLIALCAFETVAKEEYSRFCHLFNETEFEGFEYALDLDKFYYTGYGSRLGPVQGVGYINELLARLTDQPVEDHTQTNHTHDSNAETFPLGRSIYVDFSHDNLMVAVFSAMGLFKNNGPFMGGMLDPKKRPKHRDWFTSRIVPFSGRMVVERMECGLPSVNGAGDREYVRILVSDAAQDLGFCEGVDEDGLCSLHSFVKSQTYARNSGQGDWESCFE
ncbi:3-phytase A [Leucoagaricus sp. SymC.cos]|nr:3-phytase A [Leucoagaricus sp. SymC.cos]